MGDMRETFEREYSDNGESPKAIERDAGGQYKLMAAAQAWNWFQAGWEASKK